MQFILLSRIHNAIVLNQRLSVNYMNRENSKYFDDKLNFKYLFDAFPLKM